MSRACPCGCVPLGHRVASLATRQVGEDYVCSCKLGDVASVKACVDKALSQELTPFVPATYDRREHVKRVRAIFEPVLDRLA